MNLCRLVSATAFTLVVLVASGPLSLARILAQDASQAQRVSLDQVLGTVTASNPREKTFTVKEDKTGTEFSVSASSARRFLRVPPGEKDLKKAQPIDASQIAVGDRLMARGHKNGSEPKIDATIVIVMTAGDLQQKHQAEVTDWETRGIHGLVVSVDDASHQITMTQRTANGTKTVAVLTTPETQFTRYSPGSNKSSDVVSSALTDLKVGDQLRVIGDASEDGSKLTAQKIWSGSFRTIAGTIVALSPDAKSFKLKDLQTKQPVNVVLLEDSSVRRVPPEMANMLAARMNANGNRPRGDGESQRGAPPSAEGSAAAAGQQNSERNDAERGAGTTRGPAGRRGGGDLSKVIERLPKIALSELKPGDAVVISGSAGGDKGQLTASSIIAGVEPILASAPSRGGESSALGNWNLDVGVPGQ